MLGAVAAAGTTIDSTSVVSAITDQFTSYAPIAGTVIAAGAVLAFGIKGIWVAWRVGAKALGKAGS